MVILFIFRTSSMNPTYRMCLHRTIFCVVILFIFPTSSTNPTYYPTIGKDYRFVLRVPATDTKPCPNADYGLPDLVRIPATDTKPCPATDYGLPNLVRIPATDTRPCPATDYGLPNLVRIPTTDYQTLSEYRLRTTRPCRPRQFKIVDLPSYFPGYPASHI